MTTTINTTTATREQLDAERESLASLQTALRGLQAKAGAPFPKQTELIEAKQRVQRDAADAELDEGHRRKPGLQQAVEKLELELATFKQQRAQDADTAAELQRRVDEARERVDAIQTAMLLAAERDAAEEAQRADAAVDDAVRVLQQRYAESYAAAYIADSLRSARTGQFNGGRLPSIDVDLGLSRLRQPHPSIGRYHPELSHAVRELARPLIAQKNAELVAQGLRAAPTSTAGAAPRVVPRRPQQASLVPQEPAVVVQVIQEANSAIHLDAAAQ